MTTPSGARTTDAESGEALSPPAAPVRGTPQDALAPARAPERRSVLLALLFALSAAFVAIVIPFYGTLLWAVIIALLFHPMHRWLVPRLRGKRTVAALLTELVVVLMVILPLAALTAALVSETTDFYARVQQSQTSPSAYFRSVFGLLPGWAAEWLSRIGLTDLDALQRRAAALLSQGSRFIAAQALQIGQNTFELIASLFIMLYVAFFLIRDGHELLASLRQAVPLAPQHQRELAQKFSTVIRATVKGNLLVAALQGALGGLAFGFLGVPGALLWAVLMGFLSLLPAVGAALVWGPVALYFISTGATAQGVGLAAWGVLVIGLVDNVLRPVLVGKDTRLPDYVVLIATLGGIAMFGLNGFVLGPVVAAMFFAIWQIVFVERSG